MPMVSLMLVHILTLPFFLPTILQLARLALPETMNLASKYGVHEKVILEIRPIGTFIEISDMTYQKRFLAIIFPLELSVVIQESNTIVSPEVLQKSASIAALWQ